MTERDEASGLDHTLFRKHDSVAGRWTSPDPYSGSMSIGDPQSFNRYSYVLNDPINLVDPLGLDGKADNYIDADMAAGKAGYEIWGEVTVYSGNEMGMVFNHAPLGTSVSEPLRGGGTGIGGGDTGSSNPAVIDSDPKNKDCSISVSFKGNNYGPGMANGPGQVGAPPIYGVGFTVRGTVPNGETIKTLPKEPGKSSPGTGWTLEQWMWNASKDNTGLDSNMPRAENEIQAAMPHIILGKAFAWHDHPGNPMQGLPWNPITSSSGRWKFTVKAVNGNRSCSVSFFININFSNGNWSAEWGEIKP
jgi:RHS repeat-associated protein